MADVAQRIWPGLVGVLDQPFVRIGLMTLAVSAAIAWIATAFWCFRDTRARTRDVLAPYLTSGIVLLFSPLLFPFGLAVYLLVRPHETSHERDLRMLARTALNSAVAESSCRACGERIDRRWVRCPACGIRLAATCRRCDRALDPDWSICPWCAAPQVATLMPAAAAVGMGIPVLGLTGSSIATIPALGPAAPRMSVTSREGSSEGVASSRVAAGARADRDSQPVPMGPARGRRARHAQPALDRVPAPRPAASMKRLRAVREGVRTAQSLGDRRPVTGARVVQSTSAARPASAVETEAEGLGRNHAVPRTT